MTMLRSENAGIKICLLTAAEEREKELKTKGRHLNKAPVQTSIHHASWKFPMFLCSEFLTNC